MLIKPRKKVFTMNEIAAECQVSLSTVYRVLRNPEKVVTPINRQVRGLLVQNGYLEANWSSGAYNLLNVTNGNGTFHSVALYFALQQVCLAKNISLTLCDYNALPAMIKSVGARGLLFSFDLPEWQSFSLPAVVLRQGYSTASYGIVCSDKVGGYLRLFHKLKELGHKRIFYYLPAEYNNGKKRFGDHFIRDKIRSFYTLNDLDYDPSLIFCNNCTASTHSQSVAEAVDYFLHLPNRPTAVVLAGDVYAGIFYQRLREAGIRIPQDVSIAGCDNMLRYRNLSEVENDKNFVESCQLKPKLTTIDYPLEEIASTAVSEIVRLIENTGVSPRKIEIKPELIITNSIAKVKGM